MQRRWWLEAKPAQTEVADFDFARARLVENSDSAACPLPPPIILRLAPPLSFHLSFTSPQGPHISKDRHCILTYNNSATDI